MEQNENKKCPRFGETEIASLEEELRSYREEKEKIRRLIGRIGGEEDRRRDRLVHVIFLTLLTLLLAVDALHYLYPGVKVLPTLVTLELAILLVSLKIIWMIHRQAKVDHFQFWILNAIEFRLNEVVQRLRSMERNGK